MTQRDARGDLLTTSAFKFVRRGCGDVDVFVASLEASDEALALATRTLAPDEISRARRFLMPNAARRFVVARAGLRALLGERLGVAAPQVAFDYGAHGKPSLRGDALSFNLSHSGELAAVAISPRGLVGIDVEREDDETDIVGVAANSFSQRERFALESLDASKQRAAFFATWTRKEAYLKAIGSGFSVPSSSFEVSVSPDQPAAILSCAIENDDSAHWWLDTFDLSSRTVASVARRLSH
ncbi:MAG: 4'-phosphopantetheinyl transferase superfamily protein [Betaproteobacteria bacterium]|jgi:4'-phosphopantetheinyl transferase|nr:4'-phosphopantetheinyl transferase superfamily protein [Betaproteobacteria bacterium]